MAVLSTKRRTIALKDPIYEVSFVQHLVEYLLMYPGLDKYEIGWEVSLGTKWVDIVLRSGQKTVLVECKDFNAGKVNADAAKLRGLIARRTGGIKHPVGYILSLWRRQVPDDIPERVERHYLNARGLDPALSRLVASKRFTIYAPEREHAPFGVALFKVR